MEAKRKQSKVSQQQMGSKLEKKLEKKKENP